MAIFGLLYLFFSLVLEGPHREKKKSRPVRILIEQEARELVERPSIPSSFDIGIKHEDMRKVKFNDGWTEAY
jgi:hypothetical protein